MVSAQNREPHIKRPTPPLIYCSLFHKVYCNSLSELCFPVVICLKTSTSSDIASLWSSFQYIRLFAAEPEAGWKSLNAAV